MDKEKSFISAVVYLHNNEDSVKDFFAKLNTLLGNHFEKYELIAVDDNCTDQTVPRLKELAAGFTKPLTIVHMSVFHGLEDAMNAGLDMAIGDFVYEFDSTQMPYGEDLIFEAYRKSLEGNDIVCVCPSVVKGSSRLFYNLFNSNSGSPYKLQTDAFRLVTRRAINRVHMSNSYMPYRKAAYAASGLKMTNLIFDGSMVSENKGNFALAIDSLILYTNAGYKISFGITLFMMFAALAELIYTVIIFISGHPIEGWTTLMFVATFGFMGVFFVLSIIIRYLSLNLDLVFRKQKYLIERIEKIQK